MTAPLYTREILRLASAIPHVARFEEITGGAELRSPTCGARMRVAVELDREGRVEQFTQAVEACAFGQAAAALMGAHAYHSSADEVRDAVTAIERWLGGGAGEPWPGFVLLEPVRSKAGRHGAVLLPFRALLAAIEAAR